MKVRAKRRARLIDEPPFDERWALTGIVLVRSESGQLLMFHQQTLAQMKAQTQSQSAITPQLSAPASTPPVQVASLQVPVTKWRPVIVNGRR